MATAAPEAKSGKVVIKNIGLMLSGDIDKPILDADTIVVVDGIITAVGKEKDCDTAYANAVVDVRQTCVCPRDERVACVLRPLHDTAPHALS